MKKQVKIYVAVEPETGIILRTAPWDYYLIHQMCIDLANCAIDEVDVLPIIVDSGLEVKDILGKEYKSIDKNSIKERNAIIDECVSLVENKYSDKGKLRYFTKSARIKVANDLQKLKM